MPLLTFRGRPALDLTDEQFAAATGPHRDALVQACAGAGKTRTLVGRYLHRLDQGAEPDQVALVTFTRRATAEMLERLGTFIEDRRALERRVRTIDGFAQAILRGAAGEFACDRDFSLLVDERRRSEAEGARGETREGFVSALFGKGALDPDEEGTSLLGAFDGLRAQLIGEAELGRLARSPDVGETWRQAARHYPKYRDAMAKAGLFDHAEIQTRIIEGCHADPALATRLFGRFTDLLVDEYQDVNAAQVAFFKLFLTGGGRIWAVGDEDQAIFGFRHAEIERIRRFARDFPEVQTYRLGTNLRCGRAITGLARAVIAQDARRGERPIGLDERRQPDGSYLNPGRVACHEADDAEAEASWIARRLGGLVEDGMPPERIALLYRARPSAETVLDAVRAALRRQRIPVEEAGQPGVAFRTIHESKGLEFDAVFLPGLLLGILPHYRATGPAERAEERRLFYVALTRAESRLFLSWPRCRTRRSGDPETVRPSPFLVDGLAGLEEHDGIEWEGSGTLATWLARQGKGMRAGGTSRRAVPRALPAGPALPPAGKPLPAKSLPELLAGWSPAEIALLDEHLGRSLGMLQGLIQRPYGELSRAVTLARADRSALRALKR